MPKNSTSNTLGLPSTRFYSLLFIAIFLITLLLRLLLLSNNNTAFTSDQARDMLAIRGIVTGNDLPLIGPITGIPGLYLGPFWFFFNTLPFIITGGDPVSLVIWQILWFQFSALILYLYFRQSKPTFALLSSSLVLLSPLYFYTSRYFFNPHLLPAFTIFFLILLDSIVKKPTVIKSITLGLTVGISLQLEAAIAIVYLPVAILFLLKNKKSLFYFFVTFVLTLLPQILFELRHDFLMTKVFLDQLTGKNDVIQNTLGFNQLISDRLNSLKYLWDESLPVPHYFTSILFLLGIYHLKKKASVFLLASFLIFLLFYLLFLIYPHPLKSWYLYPLALPTIFVISSLITNKVSYLLLPSIILTAILSFTQQYKLIETNSQNPSLDPSNLNNRLQTVAKVYELAQGKGFNLYNFAPSVYDYPYQYLFWWQGNQRSYHPAKITYQDNVPEYIPNNDQYLELKKPAEVNFYLLEESTTPAADLWLNQFTLCKPSRLDLPWQTTIIEDNCKANDQN